MREKQSRELDGAQDLRPKIYVESLKRCFDEAVVKPCVVRDKDLSFKLLLDLHCKFVKSGLARHHVRRDASQSLDA